jgi:hypothetical protein
MKDIFKKLTNIYYQTQSEDLTVNAANFILSSEVLMTAMLAILALTN